MGKIDNVNHPAHYTEGFAPVEIECIDITRHLPSDLANAFKYVWRCGKKGDKSKAIEDLNKSLWYIDDWEEHDITSNGWMPAVVIFNLIPEEPTHRYMALKWIVHGYPERAVEHIILLQGEFEDENN